MTSTEIMWIILGVVLLCILFAFLYYYKRKIGGGFWAQGATPESGYAQCTSNAILNMIANNLNLRISVTSTLETRQRIGPPSQLKGMIISMINDPRSRDGKAYINTECNTIRSMLEGSSETRTGSYLLYDTQDPRSITIVRKLLDYIFFNTWRGREASYEKRPELLIKQRFVDIVKCFETDIVDARRPTMRYYLLTFDFRDERNQSPECYEVLMRMSGEGSFYNSLQGGLVSYKFESGSRHPSHIFAFVREKGDSVKVINDYETATTPIVPLRHLIRHNGAYNHNFDKQRVVNMPRLFKYYFILRYEGSGELGAMLKRHGLGIDHRPRLGADVVPHQPDDDGEAQRRLSRPFMADRRQPIHPIPVPGPRRRPALSSLVI